MAQIRSRENNFNLIRLLLASMVFVYHSYILTGAKELRYFQFSPSLLAVQSFFVISGYLIYASYENSTSNGDYFLKRCKRVLPAYVSVIFIATIVCSFLSTLTLAAFWSDHQTWRYVAFNLVFLNFKAPSLPGVFEGHLNHAINGSLWTLKIETMFYVFVPVIYYLIKKLGHMTPLFLIFALSITYRLYWTHLAEIQHQDIFIKMANQFPGQLSYFICGIYLYLYFKSNRKIHLIVFIFSIITYIISSGTWFWTLSPPAIAIVTIYVSNCIPVLSLPKKLGDISYGIYIYHFPLIQIAICFGLFATVPVLGFFATAMTLMLLALFSWHFLEYPAIRWKFQR